MVWRKVHLLKRSLEGTNMRSINTKIAQFLSTLMGFKDTLWMALQFFEVKRKRLHRLLAVAGCYGS